MGARQSRRSVDITTTPKKEGIPAEGGDAATPGDGKLERIEETDTKPTTNGIAPHTDVVEDKDKDKDDTTEKDKDKEKPEEVKAEETKQEPAGESPAETAEVTTPTEATPASPNTATSPDSKETKKKEKMKKKWSFRSISFSKKDKNKPAREEAPKNGDVTKEEPLAEGGEEAENGSATAGSPVEEKSAVSSPTAETESAPVAAAAATVAVAAAAAAPAAETKEESSTSAASSPAEEKAEEPTPSAPTPVPVEEKKEEVENVEAEKKGVEVSPAGGQFVPEPVEVSVFRVQTVATPSIIERKTSEDIPSLPPSSPPPTPIDSSPLQQAQQAAATATALAKVLILPAEAADKDSITLPVLSSPVYPERDEPSMPAVESIESTLQTPSSPALVHEPRSEPSLDALPAVEPTLDALPTVESPSVIIVSEPANPPVEPESFSAGDGDKRPAEVVSNLADDSPARTPYDVSFKPHQTYEPSENTTNAEHVTTEALHAAEGDPPMIPFQTRLDETVENPSETVTETIEIVEQPSVFSDATAACEHVSASSTQDETVEVALQPATIETTHELVDAKTPKPVDDKIELEEMIELVATLNVTPEECEHAERGPSIFLGDRIVDSEEGPMPISDEMLVEAKPAVVIPEDEERIETVCANILTAHAESAQLLPDVDDKLEMESRSFDAAVPTEEILISEEREESEEHLLVCNQATIDGHVQVPPMFDEARIETTKIEEESMPPPLPESPVPNVQENFDSENANVHHDSIITVPSAVVDVAPQLANLENTNTVKEFLGSLVDQVETHVEYPVMESDDTTMMPAPPIDDDGPLQTLDSSLRSENITCPANESSLHVSLSELEPHAPTLMDECLPLALEQTNNQHIAIDDSASSEYPLPPEELACSPNVSETKIEVSIPDANLPDTRNPTEMLLLTPPISPSPPSNVSIASGLTTSTKDSSQTQLYDDQSNREFKMESVSISLNSYNESDIELKERLAESLAETEKQEENSVSCQLSNNATSSTTVQETHQNTPETEIPVENNVTYENSTTESAVETTKVTPPAVPSEVVSIPTSPPSAPAITEDVASVAKAIEEMEISDKAVAAATIECNTNEIIADARYQNDINE